MVVVLLIMLAAGVERLTEGVMALVADQGRPRWNPGTRRGLAIVVSVGFGALIAFGLGVELVSPLVGYDLGRGGYLATAFALAGGAGPVHELVRLLEEAKNRRKAGKARPRTE